MWLFQILSPKTNKLFFIWPTMYFLHLSIRKSHCLMTSLKLLNSSGFRWRWIHDGIKWWIGKWNWILIYWFHICSSDAGIWYLLLYWSPTADRSHSTVPCWPNNGQRANCKSEDVLDFDNARSFYQGAFEISASTVDGIAVCRFKRKSSSSRDIGKTRLELFDLQHTSYYVIFARGAMKSG